jgi:hypothetical protein
VDRRRELERLRRRHQPLAGPHEQLVGEDFAKLGKGMADRRGAPPQALSGPRHAGIDEEGVKDDEEIGVDFTKMHEAKLFC